MSQMLDQLLKDSGVGSLDELKDRLKSGTSQSTALLQAIEQIVDADADTGELFNTLPLMASDISEERKQKETQKKLIEMSRVPGLSAEKETEKNWPTPDFKR
ncbi:MAG: hypothetical protein WAZ18_01930 [Alphaproteobacteria bacterium]